MVLDELDKVRGELREGELQHKWLIREVSQEDDEVLKQRATQSHLRCELDKMKAENNMIQKSIIDLERELDLLSSAASNVLHSEKLSRNLEVTDELRKEMKTNKTKALQDFIATLDFNYEVQAGQQGDLSTFSQAARKQ